MALPVITNNTTTGAISWTAFGVQIYGVQYSIAAGTTTNRFVWWKYNNGTPSTVTGNTLPQDLSAEDIWLFYNKNGVGFFVPMTEVTDGSMIVTGSIQTDAIAANAITATQLAANSVSAEAILANAVGAEEIAANAIYANHISAGQISTEKLTVGAISDNMVMNGGFEDGAVGWLRTAGNGAVDVVTGVASSGAQALRIMRGTSNTHVGQDPKNFIPVNAAFGRRWYVGCRAGGSVASSFGFYLRCKWYDANKVQLTTTPNTDPISNRPLTTSWDVFEGQVDIPAAARYLALETIVTTAVPAGAAVFVDSVFAREVVISAQIGNGQITTNHMTVNAISGNVITSNTMHANRIVTNTITALQIAANTITADQLAANTITASKIAAETITGDKIAVRTISANQLMLLGNNMLDNPSALMPGVNSGQSGTTAPPGWTVAAGAVDWTYGSGAQFRTATTTTTVFNQAAIMSDVTSILGTDPASFRLQVYFSRTSGAGTSAVMELGVNDPNEGDVVAWTGTIGDGNTDVAVNVPNITMEMGSKYYLRKISGNASVICVYPNLMQQSTASLVADGAITANKLTADAINGKTITGATIQTVSTANEGIKQDAMGFRAYRPGLSAPVFEIPTTGAFAGMVSINNDFGLAINSKMNLINGDAQLIALDSVTDSNNMSVYTSLQAGALTTGFWDRNQPFPQNPTNPSIKTSPTGIDFRRANGTSSRIALNESNLQLYVDSTVGVFVRGQNGNVDIAQQGTGNLTMSAAGNMTLSSTGPMILGTPSSGVVASQKVRDSTASGTANMLINATSGVMYRLTSSRRYKTEIRPWGKHNMWNLLEAVPSTWFDIAEQERWEAGEEYAIEPRRYFGMIAEEIHDLGLFYLVNYNEEGLPDSLNYDRVGVMLLPIVKALKAEIEALKAENEALKTRVTNLESTVADLAGRLDALENMTSEEGGA